MLILSDSEKDKVAIARHMQSHGAPSAAAELVLEVIFNHVYPVKMQDLQRLYFHYRANVTALVRRVARHPMLSSVRPPGWRRVCRAGGCRILTSAHRMHL